MARAYQPIDTAPLKPILVVEDEFLIALMTESTLRQMGYGAIHLAQTFEEGLRLAETVEFAFAILDVNLEGQTSFPIADVLRDRGVPFGFQTAYGPEGIEPAFKHCPVITKPFSESELTEMVEHLIEVGDAC
jgi:DNA-binding response OmpR family regulator